MNGPLGALILLSIKILATRLQLVVAAQPPHTEQQYRKWGYTILAYNVFTEAIGRMSFAYFRKPMALET